MAKRDTLKKIEMIDTLKDRVQSILSDLDELRKSILEIDNKDCDPLPPQDVTLVDIFKALEKKKHKNARFKLRQLCLDNNINTLDEFLKMSPSEFKTYRNIGTTTVYQVREVIESFGIVWSDAT